MRATGLWAEGLAGRAAARRLNQGHPQCVGSARGRKAGSYSPSERIRSVPHPVRSATQAAPAQLSPSDLYTRPGRPWSPIGTPTASRRRTCAPRSRSPTWPGVSCRWSSLWPCAEPVPCLHRGPEGASLSCSNAVPLRGHGRPVDEAELASTPARARGDARARGAPWSGSQPGSQPRTTSVSNAS